MSERVIPVGAGFDADGRPWTVNRQGSDVLLQVMPFGSHLRFDGEARDQFLKAFAEAGGDAEAETDHGTTCGFCLATVRGSDAGTKPKKCTGACGIDFGCPVDKPPAEAEQPDEVRGVSHFATCPQAQQWRTRETSRG